MASTDIGFDMFGNPMLTDATLSKVRLIIYKTNILSLCEAIIQQKICSDSGSDYYEPVFMVIV